MSFRSRELVVDLVGAIGVSASTPKTSARTLTAAMGQIAEAGSLGLASRGLVEQDSVQCEESRWLALLAGVETSRLQKRVRFVVDGTAGKWLSVRTPLPPWVVPGAFFFWLPQQRRSWRLVFLA